MNFSIARTKVPNRFHCEKVHIAACQKNHCRRAATPSPLLILLKIQLDGIVYPVVHIAVLRGLGLAHVNSNVDELVPFQVGALMRP